MKYSIEGEDAQFFVINPETGQITVSTDQSLDTAEKSEFTVIVVATDPSGKSARIEITIVVEFESAQAAASVLPYLAGEMADQSVSSISRRVESSDPNDSAWIQRKIRHRGGVVRQRGSNFQWNAKLG